MLNKVIFLAVCMLAVSTMSISAEDEKNALDYIPPSNFVGGWEANGNELLLHPNDAAFILGDDLPLLLEYDLVWFATETYGNYRDEITIEIYEFPSASDAYGFYGLSPTPYAEKDDITGIVVQPYGLPPTPKIDTIRNVADKFLEGCKDRFYFRIVQENMSEDLYEIGVYMLARFPGSSTPADIIGVLPVDDRVMGTERYIRGPVGLDLLLQWNGDDVFGFDEFDWKAASGEYRLGGGEYCLLVVAEYEDADSCSSATELLQGYFQDHDWETVILSPLENGAHPRGFSRDTCAAFWPDGNHLVLLWDLTDLEALSAALSQQGG